MYYPNYIIMPVHKDEDQRIDDVSTYTDLISYGLQSLETICFVL